MDTKKVAAEYRLSQWAHLVQTRNNSGKSIKDFCLEAGISKNAYFYWQRKLREVACTEIVKTEEPKNIVPSGWMQLKSKQEQQDTGALEIEIYGCHVKVNSDTDPDLLKKVCHILRSL